MVLVWREISKQPDARIFQRQHVWMENLVAKVKDVLLAPDAFVE
jgi:hypothetical protein